MRIAAVGDLHVGIDSVGLIAPGFADVGEHADVLLIAGDLTRVGTVDEIDVFVDELRTVDVPKIAVLGNHDHHHGVADELTERCERGGITMLDGRGVTIEIGGRRLGVVGIKGFGGGFPGSALQAFGEQAVKEFVGHAAADAERLATALGDIDAEHTVVLLHYSPIRGTLQGEPPEIYPFLGSSRFAEVIDNDHVDLVIHGHAHHGTEVGTTPGGVPVRNVAQPVIGGCYRLLELAGDRAPSAEVRRLPSPSFG